MTSTQVRSGVSPDRGQSREEVAQGREGDGDGPDRELPHRAQLASRSRTARRRPVPCGAPPIEQWTRCAGGCRTRPSDTGGRKHDPLYRIRKLLVSRAERLDDRGCDRPPLGLRVGDPHDELLGAWLAKESVRDIYLTDDPAEAALLLDKAIVGCLEDEVPEVRALGNTLRRWRTDILAHHRTGASNGPTEGLNLLVKKVKRRGHGFTSFDKTACACCCTPAESPGPRVKASEDPNALSPLKRVDPHKRPRGL
jgi:hypothetical protein